MSRRDDDSSSSSSDDEGGSSPMMMKTAPTAGTPGAASLDRRHAGGAAGGHGGGGGGGNVVHHHHHHHEAPPPHHKKRHEEEEEGGGYGFEKKAAPADAATAMMQTMALLQVALTAAPDLSAFRAAAPQGAKQQFQFAAGDAATDLMLGETATEAAPGRVTRLVADFDAQPRGRAALSLSGANKGLTWMVDGCSAAEGEALFARMQQKESPLKVFVVTAGVEGFIDLPDAYTLSLPALGALSLAQTMPLFDMQRKAGAFAHTFVTICKKDVALDKTLDLIEHQGKWAGPKLDMTFKQLGDNYYVLPGTPIAMLAQRTSYKESKAKVAAVTTESGGAVEIRGDAFPVLHQTAAGYFGKTVIPLDSLKDLALEIRAGKDALAKNVTWKSTDITVSGRLTLDVFICEEKAPVAASPTV